MGLIDVGVHDALGVVGAFVPKLGGIDLSVDDVAVEQAVFFGICFVDVLQLNTKFSSHFAVEIWNNKFPIGAGFQGQ